MLQNAYFLAKIGADTAENEQHFAETLPKISNYPKGPPGRRRARRRSGRFRPPHLGELFPTILQNSRRTSQIFGVRGNTARRERPASVLERAAGRAGCELSVKIKSLETTEINQN